MTTETLVTWWVKRWDGEGVKVGPGHAVNEKTGSPACGCRHSDNVAWEMNLLTPDNITCKRCRALFKEPQP